MAQRPVFAAQDHFPYVRTYPIEFDWNSGLNIVQKRKNIRAIHEGYTRMKPGARVLEISSASEQLPEGRALSAFFLTVFSPEAGEDVAVECAYQAAKVFTEGGPYADLLKAYPRNAKRDLRLKSSGRLKGFRFGGREFPIVPETAFYDYLYCCGLRQHPELSGQLLRYDSFTDFAFNPIRGMSCQAHTAALYKGLSMAGALDCLESFESFVSTAYRAPAPVEEREAVRAPSSGDDLCVGDTVIHPTFGEGVVLSVGAAVKIRFDAGEKALGRAWVAEKCRIVHPV